MTPGDWLTFNRRLPVFADQALSIMSAVHSNNCGAAATVDGIAAVAWCRCQSARQHIHPQTPVCVVLVQGKTVLVHEQDSGPFWIEAVASRKTKAPVPQVQKTNMRRRAPPADYLVIEAALGAGPLSYPRRRRPVNGGEIVFVRSEMGPDMIPWRLLGQTFVQDQPAALLIDASLRFELALNPGWDQQRTLILFKNGKQASPNQLVIPAFPLPDSTPDPGWMGPDS